MAVGRREWISPLQKTIVLTILIVILIATSDIALCARRSGRSRARMGSFRRGRPVRWALQSRNGGTRSISKTSGAIFARRMQRFKFPFHIANGKTGNVGRVRTDTISEPVIHHFDLARLINPHNPFVGITNWKKTLESSEQDMSYLKGFRRKRRLYCRAGKGFHLEIKKNGKVRARHVATNDSKYNGQFSARSNLSRKMSFYIIGFFPTAAAAHICKNTQIVVCRSSSFYCLVCSAIKKRCFRKSP